MANPLNILVVEDEALYAELVQEMVEDLGHHTLAVVTNAGDALEICQQQRPDLVLMDININGAKDGIDLAYELQEKAPVPVIFINRNVEDETYALARATHELAFLEKSFRKRQLQRSIDLVSQQLKDNTPTPKTPKPFQDFVMVRVNQGMQKVRFTELLFIKVEDHYCILQTAEHKYAARIALKELMKELPPHQFLQTHRSFVVNVSAIDSISNAQQTIKVGTFEVPLGRSFKEDLLKRMKLI